MQFTGIASFACCSASALCLAAQPVKSDAVHSITASFSLTAKHCLLQQAIVSRAVLLPKLKTEDEESPLAFWAVLQRVPPWVASCCTSWGAVWNFRGSGESQGA